jgi:hypothetical protein
MIMAIRRPSLRPFKIKNRTPVLVAGGYKSLFFFMEYLAGVTDGVAEVLKYISL